MRSTKNIFALIFLLLTIFSFAQSKREWMTYGDASFKNEDYKTATFFYLKIFDKETSGNITFPYEPKPYTRPVKNNDSKTKNVPNRLEQYAIHQIAECYRLNHDYNNAELWYKKSVDNKPAAYPFERYWYGDALMKNERYTSAAQQFDIVMTESERKDSVMFKQSKLKIAGCYLAADTANTKSGVSISKLDSSFNAGTASFAVNYFGDPTMIQFTSARKDNLVADPTTMEGKYYCDIFTLKKTENGWTDLSKISIPANTAEQEGAGFLTLDRSFYFFTRWSASNKKECGIYLSRLVGEKWLNTEKLNEEVNVPGYKTMHPSLTPDGSILYFSSDRPGGYGKMDLWYINLDEDGHPTGAAVNMGPMFNTSEDEITPFFHYYTSTLYFSSAGQAGFGGLDVFKSSFSTDSVWSAPKNLGSPINSSKDDAYFVLDRSQRSGFVSSDRHSCKDCKGGACLKIYALEKDPLVFDLKGTVYDAETNLVIPNSMITIKDVHGDKETFYLFTDSKGNYFTPLEEGMELYVKAQKNKYFGDAGNVTTFGLTESAHLVKDFFLSPIPEGDIVIPGIEYDLDKATLRPESKKILDDLVDFLNLNNNLTIEINSHTDDRGSDPYNMRLSNDRAKSCVEYLISKEIAAARLLPKGYGESKLLISHAATEEEHQKNRRTAFRPIKEGDIRTRK